MVVSCSNCGSANADGLDFCGNCGAPLSNPYSAVKPAVVVPGGSAGPGSSHKPSAPAAADTGRPAAPPSEKPAGAMGKTPPTAAPATPRPQTGPSSGKKPPEASEPRPQVKTPASPVGQVKPPPPGPVPPPAPGGYAEQPYPFPSTYPMPYSPYGFLPALMPMYPGGPYAMQPCFPIPYPPVPYAPYPMQQQYPMQQYATQPRPGLRPVYIVLIIIGVLLVIGGCVAAAILLTGDVTSSFKLGDATVKGMDIEFRDMVITQEGSTLALTGTYDNNSKREGSVSVPVKVTSDGSQKTVSFTVPVDANSGERFAKSKNVSYKISGATLGSLVFQGGGPIDDDEDSTEDGTTPSDKEKSTPSSSVVPVDETVEYQGIGLHIVSVKIEPGEDERSLLTINIEAENQSGQQVYIFWNEESRLIDEKGEEFAVDDYDMETDYTPETSAEGQLFIPVDNKDQIFTLQFGKKSSLQTVDLKLDLTGGD